MTSGMLVESGTQTSSGLGVGFTNQGSVGLGLTGGVTMNNMVKKYFLGPRPQESGKGPSVGCGIAAVIPFLLLAAVIPENNVAAVMFGLFIGFITFVALMAFNNSNNMKAKEWDKKKEWLTGLWVCLQCGKEWKPEIKN
jgi:hypothetical protein